MRSCVGKVCPEVTSLLGRPLDYIIWYLVLATILTDSGKTILVNCLADIGSIPVYLAGGTGAGSAAVTDTTLFSETGARVQCQVSIVTTTTANDTCRFVGTITNYGAIETITNVGLFDAASSGNLLCKADGVGQALDTNEGLEIIWDIKITGQC